jgi:hypothetical protein
MSPPAVVSEFMSVRNRQVYLLLGFGGALFFCVLIAHAAFANPNSHHVNRKGGIAVFACGLIFCLFVGIRALRIARVQLTETELIYRSAIRIRRIAKSDIAGAALRTATRFPSPRNFVQPVIELRGGSPVVLADFSTQPGAGLYEIKATFNDPGGKEIEMETLEEFVGELNDWISLDARTSTVTQRES